jgi:uncharacterized protein with FMN-binding domain
MWFLGTVTMVVLLFGYHTSTSGALVAAETVIPSPVQPRTAAAPGGGGQATAPSSNTPGRSRRSGTLTGPVVQTVWGPVQVQVSTNGDTITDVSVLQYPHGSPNDDQINGYALPLLVQETLTAQSANIDMVSGATVTSGGYVQSLQAALDEATQ